MWTFIGKLFFFRFLARSFPVSSFEITGSKLYRSFGVPCLPLSSCPTFEKERLALGTSQGLSVASFLKGTANRIIGPTSNVRSFCELVVVVFKTLLLRLKAWMHTLKGPRLP